MMCNNCGNPRPNAIVGVTRYRDDGDAQHPEVWCLECIQGKKPLRKQFDVPVEWNK